MSCRFFGVWALRLVVAAGFMLALAVIATSELVFLGAVALVVLAATFGLVAMILDSTDGMRL